MMTTTPYDARRAARIRDAFEAVYHLGHVVKDYPNVRKDGFGTSHLARIEKLLADTNETVAEMVTAERKQLLEQAQVDQQIEAQDVVVAFDGSGAASVVRAMEQTIPASLLERIASRTDCD